MNQLIVITGPSGVGKTVLSEYLLSELDLRRCVTCTTRLPRPNEKDGVDYFFLTTEEFAHIRANDGFAEYSKHYQAEYGVRHSDLNAVLQYAKVLLVLDCNGAKKVKALYDATTIFIAPPSIEVLEQRLIRRSGSAEKRIIFAKDEMAQMHDFDHVVVNDNLSEAKEALLELLSV